MFVQYSRRISLMDWKPQVKSEFAASAVKANKLFISFQMWQDEYLRWNPKEYGGVSDTRLNPEEIWMPDIELQNTFVSQIPPFLPFCVHVP